MIIKVLIQVTKIWGIRKGELEIKGIKRVKQEYVSSVVDGLV